MLCIALSTDYALDVCFHSRDRKGRQCYDPLSQRGLRAGEPPYMIYRQVPFISYNLPVNSSWWFCPHNICNPRAPITSVIHVFVRIHAAAIWLTRPLSLSCGSVSCTPSSFPSFQLGPPSKRGPCLVSNCILSHHPPLTLSRWPFLRSDRETDLLRWESSSQTYWCTCILTSLPLVLWQWQR